MTFANFIKISFIALLIAITSYFVYQHYYGEQPEPMNISFLTSQHANTVLAIDLATNNSVNHQSVLTGDDAIFVIENPTTKRYLIEGNRILALMDQNKDGRIDGHDPLYSQLRLLYFIQQPKFTPTYAPLQKAGIRAIFINKQNLSHVTDKELLDHSPGTAIMSDGSVRYIHEIKIYDASVGKK
jgi:hypothetical protein